jgi:hypothetical protein
MDASTFAPLVAVVDQNAVALTYIGLALCPFLFRREAALTVALILTGLAAAGHPRAVALVGACALVSWLIHCALYPKAACRRCAGKGRYERPWWDRATSYDCTHCQGGRRLRLGRRMLSPLLRTWRLER